MSGALSLLSFEISQIQAGFKGALRQKPIVSVALGKKSSLSILFESVRK